MTDPVRPPSMAARYALQSLLLLCLLWWLAKRLLAGAPWQAFLAIVLCALPLILVSLHRSTLGRILRRQQFHAHGILFRLFSGRIFAFVLALCFGFFSAVFVLLRLHTFTNAEWLLFLSTIAAFYGCYLLLQRALAGEYKAFALGASALRLASLLTPVLPAALSFFLPPGAAADAGSLALPEQIDAQRAALAIQGSAALQQLGLILQTWEGLRVHALSAAVADRPVLVSAAAFAEQWLLFYLLCSLLGSTALNRHEIRRSLGPLTDAARVPPLSGGTLALISGISGFVLLFIILPFAAYAELWVRQQQPAITLAEEQLQLELERIGDAWYRPGTADSVQALRASMLRELQLDHERLRRSVEAAFDGVEANIDLFLDWYYSLAGEYTRIAKLMTGELETYLADRLTETLQQGDRFAEVQEMLTAAIQRHETLQARYAEQVAAVLETNRVSPVNANVVPLRQLALTDVLTPPEHDEFLQLRTRLLASTAGGGTAGLMSSVVAAKLSSRILAKGGFKMAAKALVKLAAGKAGGAAIGAGGGAAAGAAVGSVVPGLGTAIGAVVGGLAGGVLAGIGIDKALIELEEAISRDAFKAELMASVAEAERELLAEFQPAAR